MMCTISLGGFIHRIDPALERVLGWKMEELLAVPYLSFIHSDDQATTGAAMNNLFAGNGTCTFENRFLCKDGRYKWIEWCAKFIPEEEMIQAMVRENTGRKAD